MNWPRIIDAIRTGGMSERREERPLDEWGRRKHAILADPTGRMLWETMAKHRLSLNSRSPIYGWQVERVYVMAVEDMLTALNQPGASNAKHLDGQPADIEDRHNAARDSKNRQRSVESRKGPS